MNINQDVERSLQSKAFAKNGPKWRVKGSGIILLLVILVLFPMDASNSKFRCGLTGLLLL